MPQRMWFHIQHNFNLTAFVFTTTIGILLVLHMRTTYADMLSADAIANLSKVVGTTQDRLVKIPNAIHQNTLADDIQEGEFIDNLSKQPHSRRKRLIWITDDGRLALPPGTALTFTPTIAMPLVRHPPEGFLSNISISFPVTIDFDKLGLTDNQNPLGDIPPLLARSFGHTAGRMLGNYVAEYLHHKTKRDLRDQQEESDKYSRSQAEEAYKFNAHKAVNEDNDFPQLPDRFKHVFHGGERVLLYGVVENFISTFGMNGKACLLRTICEMHSRSLDHFGFLGEITKLFLTATRSPFSEMIPEYVRAQMIGEGKQPPGECFPYYKECPKSIFKAIQNLRYSKPQGGEYVEQQVKEISPQRLPLNKVEDAEAELGNEINGGTMSRSKPDQLFTM